MKSRHTSGEERLARFCLHLRQPLPLLAAGADVGPLSRQDSHSYLWENQSVLEAFTEVRYYLGYST